MLSHHVFQTSTPANYAPAEHAPNSVLQRAILLYLNKHTPQRAAQWRSADVSTRRHTPKATPGSHTSGSSHSDDGTEFGDSPASCGGAASEEPSTFSSLLAPPTGTWVEVGGGWV
jgi:hypothetical protein